MCIAWYSYSKSSKKRDLGWPFCIKFCFAPSCLDLWSLAFEAWLFLNLYWMSSANFRPKRTAVALRDFLATARLPRYSLAVLILVMLTSRFYSGFKLRSPFPSPVFPSPPFCFPSPTFVPPLNPVRGHKTHFEVTNTFQKTQNLYSPKTIRSRKMVIPLNALV